MKSSRLMLTVSLLCTAAPVLAEDPECSRISDTAERMLCHKISPDSPPVKGSDSWLVLESKSHESDRTNALATRTAKWRVRCGEILDTATIMLNCREGEMQVVLSTACVFGVQGDESEVVYRIGEHSEVVQNFTVARRTRVISLDEHEDAIRFSKALFGESVLHMKLTPPGLDAFTATFDVDHLDREINPLRNRCDW